MNTLSKGIKFSLYAAAAVLLFPLFSAADPWDEAGRIVSAIREPVFPQHALNVREQGAAGDGSHNDLPALQQAINACSAAGGGTVNLSAGNHPPVFRNFRIENVMCREAETGIRIEGHADSPITDVVIRDVTIETAKTPLVIHEHDQVELIDVMINGKTVGK